MKIDIAKGRYWDRAWSLVDGCQPVSPGCERCWSAAGAALHGGQQCTVDYGAGKPAVFTGDITCREDRLAGPRTPLRTRKPTVWAIWNDLWHGAVPDTFIDKVFAVMALCPQHTFLCLTKRARHQAEYLLAPDRAVLIAMEYNRHNERLEIMPWPPPNVWLGVSAENQQCLDERAVQLHRLHNWNKFFSLEPLLGRMDMGCYLSDLAPSPFPQMMDGISAVILGAETGYGARPMDPDWARSVRDQCKAAGVPFFLKSMGEWVPSDEVPSAYADSYSSKRRGSRQPGRVAGEALMVRVGKKVAGRVLDGRTHDELPWRKEQAMTNPDVVSLEVARKMKDAGWPQIADPQQEGQWWVVYPACAMLVEAGVATCAQENDRETYAAPSIGQMLAECAGKWAVRLHQDAMGCVGADVFVPSEFGRIHEPAIFADAPADALGLAWCAAKGAGA